MWQCMGLAYTIFATIFYIYDYVIIIRRSNAAMIILSRQLTR